MVLCGLWAVFGFLELPAPDGRKVEPDLDARVPADPVLGAPVKKVALLLCIFQVTEHLPSAPSDMFANDARGRLDAAPLPRPSGQQREHDPGHGHCTWVFDEALFDRFDKSALIRWGDHVFPPRLRMVVFLHEMWAVGHQGLGLGQ